MLDAAQYSQHFSLQSVYFLNTRRVSMRAFFLCTTSPHRAFSHKTACSPNSPKQTKSDLTRCRSLGQVYITSRQHLTQPRGLQFTLLGLHTTRATSLGENSIGDTWLDHHVRLTYPYVFSANHQHQHSHTFHFFVRAIPKNFTSKKSLT